MQMFEKRIVPAAVRWAIFSMVATVSAASGQTIDTNASGVFEGHCGAVNSSGQCNPCMTEEERRFMPRLSIRTTSVTPGADTDSGLPISHVDGEMFFPVRWVDQGPRVNGFCDNIVDPKVRLGVVTYTIDGEVLWNENATGLLRINATIADYPEGPHINGSTFTMEGAFWRAGVLSIFDTAGTFVFRPAEGRIQNGIQTAGTGDRVQDASDCVSGTGGGGRHRCMYLISGGGLSLPTGTIAGRIESSLPTITDPQLPDRQVHRATLTVYEQILGRIRLQMPGETDAEYQAVLAQSPRTAVASKIFDREDNSLGDPDNPGTFRFEDLPAVRAAGAAGAEPVFYTIEVSDAETDEVLYELDGVTVTPGSESVLPFKPLTIPNLDLLVDREDLFITIEPFTAIGAKRSLIENLNSICATNYAPIEVGATDFLDDVEGGLIPLDDVREEAINRGIWAERAVAGGAKLSSEALELMLDGMGTLAANVFDDLTDFARGDLSSARKKQKEIENAPLVGNAFNVPAADRESLAGLSSSEVSLVALSEIAKQLKAAVKALAPFIEAALVRDGMEPNLASKRTGYAVLLLTTALSELETRTEAGTAVPAIKKLVQLTYNSLHPYFFDELPAGGTVYGFPITYCGITNSSLDAAVEQMTEWGTFSRIGYYNDRAAVIDTISEMNLTGSVLLTSGRVALEISNGIDNVEGTADALAAASPHGRAIKAGLVASKYVLNTLAVVSPMAFVYSVAPSFVEEAVYGSYGTTPPSFQAEHDYFVTAPRRQNGTIGMMGVLTEPLDVEEVVAALESVSDLLLANEIGDAIEQSFGDDPASYKSRLHAWRRSIDMFYAELAGVDGGTASLGVPSAPGVFSAGFLSLAELRALESDLAALFQDVFGRVLRAEFADPSDPDYISARLAALAAIGPVVEKMREASNIVSQAHFQFLGLPLRPALYAEVLDVTSLSTGESQITQSPESLALRVRVKNLSDVMLSDLSARLTMSEGDLASTVGSEVLVGSGTLQPDDAVDGSGADEVIVEWTLEYTGDLSWDIFGLTVELLEGGLTPDSFLYESASTSLPVDPELGDTDLDGMPDDVEAAFGLSVGTDDAAGDLDGDELPNLSELRNGTNPTMASSDGDALSDLEELTAGSDGHITDPLLADTDGDGTNDDVDGAPNDPTTTVSEESPMLGEPVVSIAETSVELTDGSESVGIVVDNAGEGELLWAVVVENPALLSVTPGPGEPAQQGGVVSIGAPIGFDFDAIGMIETTVTVVDVSGRTNDSVVISVVIGNQIGTDFCGHAVDTSLGGPVTATDALGALNAAVGLLSCDACRCDVNDSGTTTASDALMILQKAVGVDVTLTCPACS